MIKNIILTIIKLYQAVLSPDHSFWAKAKYPYGYCKFYPSCSEYMKQSMQNLGVWSGLVTGIRRILRCNPMTCGGVDAAPNKS